MRNESNRFLNARPAKLFSRTSVALPISMSASALLTVNLQVHCPKSECSGLKISLHIPVVKSICILCLHYGIKKKIYYTDTQ